MEIENLNDVLSGLGGQLTRDTLAALASGLSDGQVLTFSYAVGGGIGAFGVEGTYTDIYAPDGTVTSMYSGAVTGGLAPDIPVEFAGELGLAYVGDTGVTALEGFSVTVEGSVITGFGVTVPIGNGAAYIDDLLTAATTGDAETILGALSVAPEGTVIFVSSGLQIGAGGEVSYSYQPGGDTLLVKLFGPNGYVGPQDFSAGYYGAALAHVEQNRTTATISWEFEGENGETLTVTQKIIPAGDNRNEGVHAVIRTEVVNPDGTKLSAQDLVSYGLSRTEQVIIHNGGFQLEDTCFLAGTMVTLADGTTKPIEMIEPSDMVLSYDHLGNLVSGKVLRTFRSDVSHVLDVHGLKVTPGHVSLCGDGPFAGRHVPIIDILLSDGALVKKDGSLVRMSINQPVGSIEDQYVKVCYALTSEDAQSGQLQTGKIRVGTLLFDKDGEPVSVLDCIHAESMSFDPKTGLVSRRGQSPEPL